MRLTVRWPLLSFEACGDGVDADCWVAYPSHTRPVLEQRWQMGCVRSQRTRRILQTPQPRFERVCFALLRMVSSVLGMGVTVEWRERGQRRDHEVVRGNLLSMAKDIETWTVGILSYRFLQLTCINTRDENDLRYDDAERVR